VSDRELLNSQRRLRGLSTGTTIHSGRTKTIARSGLTTTYAIAVRVGTHLPTTAMRCGWR
jgi:hypothetical protein